MVHDTFLFTLLLQYPTAAVSCMVFLNTSKVNNHMMEDHQIHGMLFVENFRRNSSALSKEAK